MSFNSFRPYDGYALNASDNTFVTKWIDNHSSPYFDIRIMFSSNSADGYLTLEDSDDKQGTWTDGSVFPESARFVGTYGKGPTGDPVDTMTVGPITQRVLGNSTPYSFSGGIHGARWIRLKYIPHASVAMNVTVTSSWKSTS